MANPAIPGVPDVMTVTDVLEPFGDLQRCKTPEDRLTRSPATGPSSEPPTGQ